MLRHYNINLIIFMLSKIYYGHCLDFWLKIAYYFCNLRVSISIKKRKHVHIYPRAFSHVHVHHKALPLFFN